MAAFFGLLSLIPLTAAFLIPLYQYIKERYLHVLFVTLTWFFLWLYTLMMVLSYLLLANFYLARLLFITGVFAFIPMGFSLVLFVDFTSHESVDPIKSTIVGGASVAVFLLALDPNSTAKYQYPDGSWGIVMGGNFRIAGTIILLLAGIWLVYIVVRIYWKAPKKLKFWAILLIVGMIIIGIGASLSMIVGLSLVIPGFDLLLNGIGALIMAIPFALEPKLAYILPFKALRLMVIETQVGTNIFTHVWSKEQFVNDQLFCGTLQAITFVFDESLKRGNIREVHLERAVLIIRESEKHSIACLIIATNSTRSLRHALNSFSEQFFKDYSPYFSETYNLNHFESASELIEDRFSFIPEYD